MDTMAGLKQELSLRFQDQVRKLLGPGENILVSLPGSYGEAFVVSNRRALIIREQTSGVSPSNDVYTYGLDRIESAEATASGTSGCIELRVQEAASEPDNARVYFPSYDLAKFKSAAEFLTNLITSRSEAPAVAVSNDPAAGETAVCPSCGNAISKGDRLLCEVRQQPRSAVRELR